MTKEKFKKLLEELKQDIFSINHRLHEEGRSGNIQCTNKKTCEVVEAVNFVDKLIKEL